MKVSSRTDTQLVLQERPGLVWLVGGLFALSGLYVGFQPGWTLFGAAFAIGGLAITLAFANTVTCIFNLDSRKFLRRLKGPVRRRDTSYDIKDIVGVKLEKGKSSGSQSYRIVLVMSSSRRVPLTTSYSTGKSDKELVAAQIRSFLKVTTEDDVPLPGFGDLFALMVDANAAERMSAMYGGVLSEQEEAVRSDPENIEARRKLATALVMQNRLAEARAHLEHALDKLARDGDSKLAAQFDMTLEQLRKATNI